MSRQNTTFLPKISKILVGETGLGKQEPNEIKCAGELNVIHCLPTFTITLNEVGGW